MPVVETARPRLSPAVVRAATGAGLLVLAGLVASCGPPAPSFPVTIVADPGRFGSIEAAAAAADLVDWWDADPADDEACTESFAAVELLRLLPRALGVAEHQVRLGTPREGLPARGDVILIGPRVARAFAFSRPTTGAAERADAFRLAAASRGARTVVVIEGVSRSGTLAGAYALLERLGMRAHQPGDSMLAFAAPGARLPARLESFESPAFDLRGFWAWEPRGDDDFFVWMARNRFNLWTAAEPRSARLAQLGIRLSDGGHMLQQEFLQPGRRFATHPEWFGFEEGRRKRGIEGEFGLNFCTSNLEARRAFARGLVDSLVSGRLRRADVVQVWPLDGGRWCDCPECRAQGSPTDRWLAVVAEAASEVDAARRDRRLAHRVTLMAPAYLETLNPPARPAPAAFGSREVGVAFFPYFRCYAHALNDERCAEINQGMADRFWGWGIFEDRPYRGALAIGEYYNVSWTKSLPVVLPHVMAADLRYYSGAGARDFFYMHAPTRRFGTWALNHALLARLLWDPARDEDSLVADFAAREYAGAGPPMRDFYAALERGTANLLALQHAVGSVGTGNHPRLLDPKVPIFLLRHLSEAPRPMSSDSAASLTEIAAAMVEARAALDSALAIATDRRARVALADVEERFAYGEAMIEFWIALIRGAAAHRAGLGPELRAQVARADSAAARLRGVTDLVQVAASHANARDGLEASGAVRVYERLRAASRTP